MARTTAAQKAAAVAVVAESLSVDPDALAAFIASQQKPAADAKAKAEPAAPAKTFAQVLEDGITAAGYGFTSGRTYVSKASIEAQARLAAAKKPAFEIVQSEKSGTRTAAVAVVRDETGKVYVQNLRSVG